MTGTRKQPPPTLNQSAWQLSDRGLYHIVSLRCLIAFVEVGKKDITEDSQQKDESRLRLVCLSLNEPCQERVISSVFCELDGWIFLFCISDTL